MSHEISYVTITVALLTVHFPLLTKVFAGPSAALSKVWVFGRSPAEIVGSNPTRRHGCLSVVIVVCCQVEVSATG